MTRHQPVEDFLWEMLPASAPADPPRPASQPAPGTPAAEGITDGMIANVVSMAEARSARRLARPWRQEVRKPDPRCPVCSEFYGKRATEIVDGVRVHRACRPGEADG